MTKGMESLTDDSQQYKLLTEQCSSEIQFGTFCVDAPQVEAFVLPPDLPALQIRALEQQRPKGSQAVFAAFILDVSAANGHLYQVGDVSAIIHPRDGAPSLVEAPPKGRWSTAGKSLHQ